MPACMYACKLPAAVASLSKCEQLMPVYEVPNNTTNNLNTAGASAAGSADERDTKTQCMKHLKTCKMNQTTQYCITV